jgi:hypothetical protein
MAPPNPFPAGAGRVTEVRAARPASLVHPDWSGRWRWLVQGTTVRVDGAKTFDLGLFSSGSPEAEVRENWEALTRETGADVVVHSRQVHGCDVHAVPEAPESPEAPALLAPADGHVSDRPGVVLAVTAADCVPVFLVDPERRVVGAVHAGWRGAAAGVLERALSELTERFGSSPADVRVHFGPAICGSCYEVGPEVFEALGLRAPTGPTPIDLRAALSARAVRAGIRPTSITVSTHCTRCTGSELFSHRGGDAGRHVGFIGLLRTPRS